MVFEVPAVRALKNERKRLYVRLSILSARPPTPSGRLVYEAGLHYAGPAGVTSHTIPPPTSGIHLCILDAVGMRERRRSTSPNDSEGCSRGVEGEKLVVVLKFGG
jgi:hypothetical protein